MRILLLIPGHVVCESPDCVQHSVRHRGLERARRRDQRCLSAAARPLSLNPRNTRWRESERPLAGRRRTPAGDVSPSAWRSNTSLRCRAGVCEVRQRGIRIDAVPSPEDTTHLTADTIIQTLWATLLVVSVVQEEELRARWVQAKILSGWNGGQVAWHEVNAPAGSGCAEAPGTAGRRGTSALPLWNNGFPGRAMRLQYAIHEAGAAHVVKPSEAMLREASVRALLSLCTTRRC